MFLLIYYLVFYGKWGIGWRQHDIIDHNTVDNISGCALDPYPHRTPVWVHMHKRRPQTCATYPGYARDPMITKAASGKKEALVAQLGITQSNHA